MSLTAFTGAPTRVTDAVREHLRQAVLSGELQPGQQLSVPRLAEALDVSRGSVREAVLQLVADGLAEERVRRGVVVAALGATEVRHLHQIREVTEGLAAALCATSATAALVEDLEAVLVAQERAVADDDGAAYADTDEQFHLLLARACTNPVLTGLVERHHAQMKVALAKIADTPEHRRLGNGELHQVLDAVRAGAPERAEARMRAHIRRTRTALETDERTCPAPEDSAHAD